MDLHRLHRVRFPCVVGQALRGHVVRLGALGAVVLLPGRQDIPGSLLFEYRLQDSRVKFRAHAHVEHAQFRRGFTRASLRFAGGELVPV